MVHPPATCIALGPTAATWRDVCLAQMAASSHQACSALDPGQKAHSALLTVLQCLDFVIATVVSQHVLYQVLDRRS